MKECILTALHIFIDTNVLLAFYAYTKDDVDQLEIVSELIKTKKLILYVPAQVVSEYKRNREVKLAESIRDFNKSIVQGGIPRFMTSFAEVKAYQDALKAFQVAKDGLTGAAREAAENQVLAADKILDDLLSAAVSIETTEKIIAAAQVRKILGNPPGKKDSHGDQINWESLLKAVPVGTTMYVISKDGDFASPLMSTRPHQFLIDEWKAAKKGDLFLHEELRPFLKGAFPDINMAVDVEKTAALERLENSGAFSSTHYAIARLETFSDILTWSDADRIFTAGLQNQQISWIGSDEDVHTFYSKLISKFTNKLDKSRLDKLIETFKPE